MGGFVDAAAKVISLATQRVEVAAANISNIDTAGYKRELSFSSLVGAKPKSSTEGSLLQMSPGKLIQTSNPYDLAILNDGFFVVASSDGVFYTRGGQFHRDADGRLVTPDGLALQSQDGGDLELRSPGAPRIMRDGAVLESESPAGRVAVVDLGDARAARYAEDGVIEAPSTTVSEAQSPVIQQGAYESSNVSMGDEMVSIMLSLRQAETAQKLINVYDDLTGRVIDTFGQAGGS